MKKYLTIIVLLLVSLISIGQSKLIQLNTDELTGINVKSTNYVEYGGTIINGTKSLKIAIQLKYAENNQNYDYVLGIRSTCNDYFYLNFYHCFDDSSKVMLKCGKDVVIIHNIDLYNTEPSNNNVINQWGKEIYFYGVINKKDIQVLKTIPLESVVVYYDGNYIKFNSAITKKRNATQILIKEFNVLN